MIQPISTRGNRSVVTFLVGGTLLLLVQAFFQLAPTVAPDPLTAAWHRIQAAGSYAFHADIEQLVSPAPTVTNIGRSVQNDRFTLQGRTDLANQAMDLRLWGKTGSLLLADTATELRLHDGTLTARQPGQPWQPIDDFTESFAPQGDFLSYLQAMRDPQELGTETRASVTFTRYGFTMDGSTLANQMQQQLQQELTRRGELPIGLELAAPTTYEELDGTGELWLAADGLPVRQLLTLTFPSEDGASTTAQLTVDFSDYGQRPWHLPALHQSCDRLSLSGAHHRRAACHRCRSDHRARADTLCGRVCSA